MESINSLLHQCADDIRSLAGEGKICLEAQVRAYDLLSLLLDDIYEGACDGDAVKDYIGAYEAARETVEAAYDGDSLKDEAEAAVASLKTACSDARFQAASAAGLHEFAKETFGIWETGGVFMRRRALKALRERAGFPLESHRIGNYVARTFDLMNEAQVRFAHLQQQLFAADVTYKIKPGIHSRIYSLLSR